ncbi:MAG: sigma-70 family RNA polymerase sigma factor [Thermoanaerobaculia bacterium]|nr:sigma-70 family RNA polymerase sigma factor [Thermoanaerobaculia bacterium]
MISSRQPFTVDAAEPLVEADPDWTLVQRVADGDEEAFAQLVDRHERRILSVCHRMLGDEDLARDASQEVFLKLFRHAGRFEPKAKVSTWLYRIAVNHCLNRLRRRKIVRWLSLEGSQEDSLAPQAVDEAADPEREAIGRQQWLTTRQAIDALPANQKSVLILAKFEGLSYREISEVLEISFGAVESRLVRAMRNLHKALPNLATSNP